MLYEVITDMRVLAFDPFAREAIDADDQAEWADLDDLLRESDFVSVHTLLSDETRRITSYNVCYTKLLRTCAYT